MDKRILLFLTLCLFANVELKSKWYGPEDSDGYDYSDDNPCLSRETKSEEGEEGAYKKYLENYQAKCLKKLEPGYGQCAWIIGYYVKSDVPSFDCFWDKYSESFDDIKEFWATNDGDEETQYQLLAINKGNGNSAEYSCIPGKGASFGLKAKIAIILGIALLLL
ncbi:MAG: hypothetical protein MJ252_30175 [archaeon]|nr:hypothetical protein [archaeon]